ncbi:unnamed protein product [Trichogramma brassicae]|uniref:Endonuclease/exonuclease/phosphatase domain-containing protein n=1 Tax=Trichogramma brassicae TaxID=86971 RepID=A0A6H5IVB0_9HYME|nr:unnamed protein product [Trichogramma brassicae]
MGESKTLDRKKVQQQLVGSTVGPAKSVKRCAATDAGASTILRPDAKAQTAHQMLSTLRCVRTYGKGVQERALLRPLPGWRDQTPLHHEYELSTRQEAPARYKMTRILQLNLNHCMAAQSLLMQSVKKMKIDVAILCDQHRDLRSPHTWISDADSQVAIWVRGGVPVQRRASGQSRFYTWAQIAGIYFFSVYAPPRLSIGEFASLLASIVDEARGKKKPVLLAGDFNAWSTEWGSSESRPRGEMLLDAISPLDVLLLNTGSRSTFCWSAGRLRDRSDLRQ